MCTPLIVLGHIKTQQQQINAYREHALENLIYNLQHSLNVYVSIIEY